MRATRAAASGAFGWLLLGALAAYAGGLVLDSLADPVGLFDEAQQLIGAALVAEGAVPHRDFTSPYTPLGYYLTAAAFALLGPSVVSARLLACGLYALALLGLLLHARALASGPAWRALAVGLGGALLVGNAFVHNWWDAFVFGYLVVLLYLAWRRGRGRRRVGLVAVGALTGVLATAKLNFAVYVAAILVADLLLETLARRSPRGLRDTAVFLAAGAVPLAIYLVPYAGFAGEVVDQVVVTPARRMGGHRILTLGADLTGVRTAAVAVFPLLWLALREAGAARPRGAGLALGAAGVALSLLGWVNLRHERLLPMVSVAVFLSVGGLRATGARLERDELVALLCIALFGHYALSRADAVHLAVLGPWVALLLPLLLFARLGAGVRLAAGGLVAVLFLPPWPGVIARSLPDAERVQAGLELLGSDAFTLRQGEAQALLEGPFPPAAALLGLYPDRDEIRALRFVHAYSGRGARVYVGVARHGQAYLASLRSYWILGRTPVVRDYFLLPGVTTRREVQERMAADLERHGVDWVVLWHGSGGDPDFARRGHVGSEFLDRQIESRYRLVVRFGSYGVYRLRAPVAPALRSGAAPESASERHQSKTVRLTSR